MVGFVKTNHHRHDSGLGNGFRNPAEQERLWDLGRLGGLKRPLGLRKNSHWTGECAK